MLNSMEKVGISNTWRYSSFMIKLENRICRQIQDLHASFGIKERRKHRGRSRSCTNLFLPQEVEIELIFDLRAAFFRDTDQFSKLPYLGMKLGRWQKFQGCTYTLFLPKWVEIELSFVLWAAVSKIMAVFQNCHISV